MTTTTTPDKNINNKVGLQKYNKYYLYVCSLLLLMLLTTSIDFFLIHHNNIKYNNKFTTIITKINNKDNNNNSSLSSSSASVAATFISTEIIITKEKVLNNASIKLVHDDDDDGDTENTTIIIVNNNSSSRSSRNNANNLCSFLIHHHEQKQQQQQKLTTSSSTTTAAATIAAAATTAGSNNNEIIYYQSRIEDDFVGNYLSTWYLTRLLASSGNIILSEDKMDHKVHASSQVIQHLKRYDIYPTTANTTNNSPMSFRTTTNTTNSSSSSSSNNGRINNFSWKNLCHHCIHEKKMCSYPHQFYLENDTSTSLDHAIPMIQYDMKNLLQDVIQTKRKRSAELKFDEVAIHIRIGDIIVEKQVGYGLLPNYIYSKYIPKDVKSIGLITAPYDGKYSSISSQPHHKINKNDINLNQRIVQSLQHYLQTQYPTATVAIHNSKDEPLDVVYARMIGATKILFCGLSTFCLFPALGRGQTSITTTTTSSSSLSSSLPITNNTTQTETETETETMISYIVQGGVNGATLNIYNNNISNSWLYRAQQQHSYIHYIREPVISSKSIVGKNETEIMHLIEADDAK